MSRLLDDVIAHRRDPDIAPFAHNLKPDLVAFDVQSATDLFWAHNQDFWDYHDFPCIAPPFGLLWMEARRPPRVCASGKELPWVGPDAYGTFMLSQRLSPPMELHRAMIEQGSLAAGTWFQQWGLVARLGHTVVPVALVFNFVAPDGACKPVPRLLFAKIAKMLGMEWKDPESNMMELLPESIAIYPAVRLAPEAAKTIVTLLRCSLMLALSFIHCRGVTIKEAPPASAKLAKARERRGKAPLVQFKVLEIGPAMAAIRKEAGDATGLKRALHICRGHFIRYDGQDGRGLLFGKHKAIVWQPQHVRGDLAAGKVIKEYAVAPGEPAQTVRPPSGG